jgi:L-cysteine desulfidase
MPAPACNVGSACAPAVDASVTPVLDPDAESPAAVAVVVVPVDMPDMLSMFIPAMLLIVAAAFAVLVSEENTMLVSVPDTQAETIMISKQFHEYNKLEMDLLVDCAKAPEASTTVINAEVEKCIVSVVIKML